MLHINKILAGGRGLAPVLVRRAATVALDWSPGFPHTGLVNRLVDPRSKVHKTGAVRAEKRTGKKRP